MSDSAIFFKKFYNFTSLNSQVILHRDKTIACSKSIRMRPIKSEN